MVGLLDVAVTVSVWVSSPPAEMPVRLMVCWPASSGIGGRVGDRVEGRGVVHLEDVTVKCG